MRKSGSILEIIWGWYYVKTKQKINDNAQGKKRPHEINAVRMLKNDKAIDVNITAEI